MEWYSQLVVVGRTCYKFRAIAGLLLLLFSLATVHVYAQSPSGDDLKKLFEESRWKEIVDVAANQPESSRSADTDYYLGSAFAQLGDYDKARGAFLAGHRIRPGDKRFLIELAGVEFREKNYSGATKWLRAGLRLDPNDDYANNFLATIYLLEGNLEAALKYWNRTGKPQIANVQFDPVPRVRAALLDQAFAFSPGSTLKRRELLTSDLRVAGLAIFSVFDFRLNARDDGMFDLAFAAQERNGIGDSKLEVLVGTFGSAWYQTIYPSYYNLGKSAVNVGSLFRWDPEKRRVAATLSGPWRMNPKWRYSFGVDLRNENWAIRDSFTGPAPVLGSLNLQRAVGSAAISSFSNATWNWSAGAEISYHDYRNVDPGVALTPSLLSSGYELKQITTVKHELLRVPERRLALESRGTVQLARIWSQPSNSFAKLEGEVGGTWYPKARGDDYAMQCRFRAGKTFGDPPFDELFMLGMERDNGLWLRAHIGTRDGIKGSAPLGQSYFLSNWEMDKNVYSNGLVGLKLGPFVDTGKMMDTSAALATPKWMWDTGAQAKVSAFGVGVVFIYGKDLRTGNNAFFATVMKASSSRTLN